MWCGETPPSETGGPRTEDVRSICFRPKSTPNMFHENRNVTKVFIVATGVTAAQFDCAPEECHQSGHTDTTKRTAVLDR